MKTVTIDPDVKRIPGLASAIDRANEQLDVELGRSSDLVSGSWLLTQDDRDRTVVLLTISDWTGQVESRFAPDELRNEWHMQGRLIRLWGDLLQIRSHRLLDEIQAAAAGGGD